MISNAGKNQSCFQRNEAKKRQWKCFKNCNINFSGNPKIVFRIDIEDKQWFDNALEKIDFVLELLPYHLDPKKYHQNISEIIYKFDSEIN